MKETFWEEMAEEEKKNPKIYYIACLKLLKEKKNLKEVGSSPNLRLSQTWDYLDTEPLKM